MKGNVLQNRRLHVKMDSLHQCPPPSSPLARKGVYLWLFLNVSHVDPSFSQLVFLCTKFAPWQNSLVNLYSKNKVYFVNSVYIFILSSTATIEERVDTVKNQADDGFEFAALKKENKKNNHFTFSEAVFLVTQQSSGFSWASCRAVRQSPGERPRTF